MPAPHAGAEARDAKPLLVDGKTLTLFELLRGTWHTLLVLPGLGPARWEEPAVLREYASTIRRLYGDRVRVYLALTPGAEFGNIDPDSVVCVHDIEGSLHRRYGATAGRLFLVRPDGYVGFCCEPHQLDALLDHLKNVLYRSDLKTAGQPTVM